MVIVTSKYLRLLFIISPVFIPSPFSFLTLPLLSIAISLSRIRFIHRQLLHSSMKSRSFVILFSISIYKLYIRVNSLKKVFIYFDNKRWNDKQRASKQLYVFVKSVFVDGAARFRSPGPLWIHLVVFLERFIEKFGLKKRSIWEKEELGRMERNTFMRDYKWIQNLEDWSNFFIRFHLFNHDYENVNFYLIISAIQ